MQKKVHIPELLKRYILNECNSDETEKVISYFKNATNSNDVPSVEDILKLLRENDELKISASNISFQQILKVAKEKSKAANSKEKKMILLRKYVLRAAVFVGIVAGGYLFLENQNTNQTDIVPADAITLELEDGSIKVLSEDGFKVVLDKNGNALGQQKGSQISYLETKPTDKLVYNTLTVPFGKRFDLKLSDGTTVHLNAGTSLRYPVSFIEGQHRNVYLSGEAFFGVSKDSLHPFVVNAGALDVRVLGTQFNVSSYPEDDRTDVVLVEGSVGMHEKTETFNATFSTLLEPGFKGSYEKSNGEIETQAVITDIYTSWIGGELVFRNMAFENILRKMERHFNVSIKNKNEGLAKEIFNASYGRVSLQKVLEDLRLTHGIEYTINGTNITIN